MTDISSQFLYSYIDELLKSEWVEWSEGVFSSTHPEEDHVSNGFQRSLGAESSDIRSRASEAHKLGLLKGPLVSNRTGGRASMPRGWQIIVEGNQVHTPLGHLAYLIGKFASVNPTDEYSQIAFDTLATLLILHIGFQFEGRWFSTVLIYEYIVEEVEEIYGRKLSPIEDRILSGAVINSLDSNLLESTLNAYRNNERVQKLHFCFRDGSIEELPLNLLSEISSNKSVNINSIKKSKAALFWARPERGIYSRASHPIGSEFIRDLVKLDSEMFSNDDKHLLTPVFESIEARVEVCNIFSIGEAFESNDGMKKSWSALINQLEEVVKHITASLESLETNVYSLEAARDSANKIFADRSNDDSKSNDLSTVKTINENPGIEEKLGNLIEQNFNHILSDELPRKNQTAANKRRVRLTLVDFEKKENKDLGDRGELFVLLYEKQKLQMLGLPNLARNVTWASKEMGDGLGFDIISFDEDQNKIFIEVKTTNHGKNTDFFITSNELSVSKELSDKYYIYRVYEFSDNPKIIRIVAPFEKKFNLIPINYRAQFK